MQTSKRYRKQAGYASWEIFAFAGLIAVGLCIATLCIEYMGRVKAERRAKSPILQKKKQKGPKRYLPVEPGEEFGSFVITFNL